MANRVYNFNPGPATLPLEVLEIVQKELLDYRMTGMSIMESSHRGAEFDEVNTRAMELTKEIFGLGDNYHVLFMTGGASTQFALIPMNFLAGGKTGVYVDTGSWSTKAIKEANIVSKAHVAFSGKDGDYKHIPTQDELDFSSDGEYVHITTNNTIKGTQWHYTPDTKGLPLIADMSSDIACRKMDYTKYDMFYAGAQKNLGPSGVTLVCMTDDMLKKTNDSLPTMFKYTTYAEKDSLDLHSDYFRGTAEKDSRSWMNITMRLPNEDLEKKLIADAKAAGFVGLKGHRSVGGIRVSIYNAMTLEGVEKLVEFMEKFKEEN